MNFISILKTVTIGTLVVFSQLSIAKDLLDGGSGGGGGGNALTSYSVPSLEADGIVVRNQIEKLPNSKLIYFHFANNQQWYFSIAVQINDKWSVKQFRYDQRFQYNERLIRLFKESQTTNDWAEIK